MFILKVSFKQPKCYLNNIIVLVHKEDQVNNIMEQSHFCLRYERQEQFKIEHFLGLAV